jgi:transcriptional regulator with XRE-family HTH domain
MGCGRRQTCAVPRRITRSSESRCCQERAAFRLGAARPGATVPRRVATIAQRIRQRRLELGLSLREASSEGVSATHVYRLEQGDRRPSMKALRSLATTLDVSVHWLETGEDDPATELARLVLEYRERALPVRARTLARKVLASSARR